MIRPPLRGNPVEPALDFEISVHVDPASVLFITRPPRVPQILPPASMWMSQQVPFEPIWPCNGLVQAEPPFVDMRIPEEVAAYTLSLLFGSQTMAPILLNVDVPESCVNALSLAPFLKIPAPGKPDEVEAPKPVVQVLYRPSPVP